MYKQCLRTATAVLLCLAVLVSVGSMLSFAEEQETYTTLLYMAEAENAQLFGHVSASNASGASKGKIAGGWQVTADPENVEDYIVFDVYAPADGLYKLVIAGVNAESSRRLHISVNGGEAEVRTLNSNSWSKPADCEPIMAELKQGKNEIKCFNATPNVRCPNLDVLKVYAQHPFAAEENAVYLSDLDWESATCGWSGREVQKDKSIEGGKIVLASDEPYAKGIGTHAGSEIVYKLGSEYTRFRSAIGVAYNKYGTSANVIFKVLGDGDELYNSGEMKGNPYTPPQYIDVDVTGVDELKLIVDENGSNSDDWANFANARLIRIPKAVDRIYLEIAIREAEALDAETYTPESWAVLTEALDAAKALTETANQPALDAAEKALRDAIAALDRIKPPTSDDFDDYRRLLATLEAESGEMHGRVDNAGTKAGNIGNGPDNYLLLRVNAAEAGRYKLVVAAMCNATRNLYITVNNGAEPILISGINSGDWFAAKKYALLVDLEAGENTLKFHNDTVGEYAPDLDKIMLFAQGVPEGEENMTYLSDMEWVSASSGWANHPVQKDNNVGGSTIQLGGVYYQKGLGTHADSTIVYDLERMYRRFCTTVGVEQNRSQLQGIFKVLVYGDDRLLFESDRLTSNPYSAPLVLDLDVTNVRMLKLVVDDLDNNSGDWASWGDARVQLNTDSAPRLKTIGVNGEEITGFHPDTYTYDVELPPHTTDAPVVTAAARLAEHSVEIRQADGPDGTASITVTAGEESVTYTLNFSVASVRLEQVELTVDETVLSPYEFPGQTANARVLGYNNDGSAADLSDATITYQAQTLYVSGDSDVVHIDENGQITTVTEPVATDGAQPDLADVYVGGMAQIYADVTVGGLTVRSAPVNVTVRPYRNHYESSIVGKIYLAAKVSGPDADKPGQSTNVVMTFEQALEAIEKIDNLTRGIPKIFYLVGWQFNGHDTGYPDWSIVNPALAREGEDAVESLKWLMDEAYEKYNTTVSLHINTTDANDPSPLRAEYIEKDVLARNLDGSLVTYGFGNTVCYTMEWELGLLQRRIDQLVEMLDGRLERAGTIHSDAYHSYLNNRPGEAMSPWHEEKYGYGLAEDVETQRRVYRYWRSKGIDLTSEHASTNRTDDWFVGLQAMAWYYELSDFMNIPASLYCGGDTSQASLFGANSKVEGILKQDPDTMNGLMKDFASKTLVFQFLNSLKRISYENGVAVFSDGVVNTGNHIEQNGRVIQDGNNLFIPALWVTDHQEIYAYSADGYQDRTWILPDDWAEVEHVDLYRLSLSAPEYLATVPVEDGGITLTLAADSGVAVVPAKTDITKIYAAVDRSALEQAVDAAKAAQNSEQYTTAEASVRAAFDLALAGAEQILADDSATQAQVDHAAQLLRSATEDLPAVPLLKGDVDGNGTVNVSDIMTLKNLIMNSVWTEEQLARGDMNNDGTLTVGDILSIKSIIMSK